MIDCGINELHYDRKMPYGVAPRRQPRRKDLLSRKRLSAGNQKFKAAVRTMSVMTAMLESPGTTVQCLRNMFGREANEKTATVLKNAGIHTEKPSAPARPKAPGHGRNGANAYRGAHRIQVPILY
jgi:hypothetical protein